MLPERRLIRSRYGVIAVSPWSLRLVSVRWTPTPSLTRDRTLPRRLLHCTSDAAPTYSNQQLPLLLQEGSGPLFLLKRLESLSRTLSSALAAFLPTPQAEAGECELQVHASWMHLILRVHMKRLQSNGKLLGFGDGRLLDGRAARALIIWWTTTPRGSRALTSGRTS